MTTWRETFISPCTSTRHRPSSYHVSPSADQLVLSPQGFHDRVTHDYQHQHHGAPPSKPIAFPSPLAKKIRMAAGNEWQGNEEQRQAPLTPSTYSRHNRSHSTTPRHSPPKRPTATNLSPCHICHRKPTKKTELDSYADCEGCGRRTCYVCIRECLGSKGSSALPTPVMETHDDRNDENLMRDDREQSKEGADEHDDDWGRDSSDQSFSMEDAPATEGVSRDDPHARMKGGGTWGQGGGRGHRGRICSQCCVEEGPEGEVICLGCLGT